MSAEPDCTEPYRAKCPRFCHDFCNKAEQEKASGIKPGDVLLQSPLSTQILLCGNRVPVENPTTIRVQ